MSKRSTPSPDPTPTQRPTARPHIDHPRSVPIEDSEARDRADQPFEEGVHDAIDPDLRHRLISEAAFELYRRRGFVDGYDLDDWLQAEEEVDHLLLHAPTERIPDTGRRSKGR